MIYCEYTTRIPVLCATQSDSAPLIIIRSSMSTSRRLRCRVFKGGVAGGSMIKAFSRLEMRLKFCPELSKDVREKFSALPFALA